MVWKFLPTFELKPRVFRWERQGLARQVEKHHLRFFEPANLKGSAAPGFDYWQPPPRPLRLAGIERLFRQRWHPTWQPRLAGLFEQLRENSSPDFELDC